MIVHGREIKTGVNLCGEDLTNLDLHNKCLRQARLRCASLRGANLNHTNLRGANLRFANLRDADLSDANLTEADLSYADLRGANISGANFKGASLQGAKLPEKFFYPLACPSDGSFIGWKKVDNVIVKLEISEKAKRCSATSKKCRCEYAKVLGFYNFERKEISMESITNCKYTNTRYTKGEYVYPDYFDENRWNECSHGIHFFVNFRDARDY